MKAFTAQVIEEEDETKEIDREVKDEDDEVISFTCKPSSFKVRVKDIADETISFTGDLKEIERETISFTAQVKGCQAEVIDFAAESSVIGQWTTGWDALERLAEAPVHGQ